MGKAPESTLCLINFNNGVYDVTGQSTVTNVGVDVSNSQIKFGESSGFLSRSESDYILITLPSEALTLSFWFYSTNSNSANYYPTLWSTQAASAYGGTYTHIDDGSYSTYPVYRANSTSSSGNNGSYGSTKITRNVWHHFAYCRNGSSHLFFLDGVLQKTITQSSYCALTELAIGTLLSSNNPTSGTYFSGYIDNIMLSSECLWTANFSVPDEYTWDNEVDPPIRDISYTASTNYGTYSGSIANLTDGNTSTYWWTNNAQSSGTFVQFTFSTPVLFNGLTAVTLNNTGDCLKSNQALQYTINGTDWITVGNFDGNTTYSFSNLNLKNVLAVRIYATSSVNQWLCVNEITLDYTLPPPIITVQLPDKSKISNISGYTESLCNFTSDQDLVEWEARATLENQTPGRGVGLLVESGTNLHSSSVGIISVLNTELTNGDGIYIISVYGMNIMNVWSS